VSRSYKKTPITGVLKAVQSEKMDKKRWHRKWRRVERENLAQEDDFDFYQTVLHKEVSDPWLFGKDGKYWCGSESGTNEYLRCMRK